MAESVTIKRLSDNKIFQFDVGEVSGCGYGLSIKNLNIETADGKAENNLSVNLGTTKTINVTFKFLNSQTQDASDGTNTPEVKTIEEKINYLFGVKASNGVDFTIDPFLETTPSSIYLVDIVSHTGASILNNKCQVGNFSIDFAALSPRSLPGRMTFTLGGGLQ